MDGLKIRHMENRDLDAVCRIEEETFSLPWSRKAFRDSLSLYHTIFLVAELDGKIAGYCGGYQSLEEAEITNVAVQKDLRRRGIARALLEEFIRAGTAQGAFAYTLEVRVSNKAAIRLYESLDFQSVGIRKNFYDKPREDAMIMWRHWQK